MNDTKTKEKITVQNLMKHDGRNYKNMHVQEIHVISHLISF